MRTRRAQIKNSVNYCAKMHMNIYEMNQFMTAIKCQACIKSITRHINSLKLVKKKTNEDKWSWFIRSGKIRKLRPEFFFYPLFGVLLTSSGFILLDPRNSFQLVEFGDKITEISLSLILALEWRTSPGAICVWCVETAIKTRSIRSTRDETLTETLNLSNITFLRTKLQI